MEEKIGNTKTTTGRIRTILRIIVILLMIPLFLSFLIQIPFIQNLTIDYISNRIEEKIERKVDIKKAYLNPFKGLELENFYVQGENDQDTLIALNKLTISLAKNLFSLVDKELSLQEVELDGTSISITKVKGETKSNLTLLLEKLTSGQKQSEKSDPLKLGLNTAILKNIEYQVLDQNTETSSRYYLKEGEIEFNTIDINKGILDLSSFVLMEPYVEIIKGGRISEVIVVKSEGIDSTITAVLDSLDRSESVNIDLFEVVGGTFIFKDLSDRQRKNYESSIDLKDFALKEIDLAMDSLEYTSGWSAKGNINAFRFVDNKGFGLQELSSSQFVVSDQEISLPGMTLKTDNSIIESDFSFLYDGFEDFNDFSQQVYIRADLNNASVALADLIHFVPDLNESSFFAFNRDKKVNISGKYRGAVDRLSGRNVGISIGEALAFQGNFGTINLTNADQSLVNLKIEQLNTSMEFLHDFIPSFQPPDNFYKLGDISFSGRFDGYFQDFVAVGNLQTFLGSAYMDMRLDVKNGNEDAKYSGELRLIDFDLKQWSDSEDFGKVTFYAKVNDGRGLTLNNAFADLNASVESIVFKEYEYKNLEMDGKVEENQFNGDLTVEDDNIKLDFTGDVSYIDSVLSVDIDAEIGKLDLQKLNLTDKSRNISGILNVNIQASDPTDAVGIIEGSDITIVADTVHHLDSLYVYSYIIPGQQSKLDIFSDYGSIAIEGNYKLGDVIPQVKNIIKKNYPYHTRNWSTDTTNYSSNNFVVNLEIIDTKRILELAGVNDLRIKNFRAKGNLDSDNENFNFDSDIEYIKYKNNDFHKVDLVTGNRAGDGFLVLNIDSSSISGRELNPVYLETDFEADQINFTLSTEDIFDSIEVVDITGSLLPHDMGYKLNIRDNEWKMLGSTWRFYTDNEIAFGKKYLSIRDLIISDGYRDIEIQDIDNQGISAQFKRFNFLILNGIIDYDKIDFSGEGDVRVRYEEMFGDNSYLQASAYFDDLRLNEVSYGVLDVTFDKAPDNSYKALASLAKGERTVKANVTYDSDKNMIDGNVKGRNFPLKFFEFILTSGISETQGYANVDAAIFGPPDDIKLDGEAMFHDCGVKIDYLGTSFFFDEQRMKISESFLDVSGGTITDIEGNPGSVTGGLHHTLIQDFRLDVSITSDDAVILNTTKTENPIYYGFGKGQVNAKFTGTFGSPNIDVTGVTTEGTLLNIPVEYYETGYDESFITFIDKEELLAPKETKEEEEFKIEGLNLEMNLRMTPDARVRIIFNENLGDVVQGVGRGNLQIFARRSGEFEIYGDYEVEQGEYLFTAWGVVAKPFIVERGGRIRWTGDPINASLDIKAEYNVRAPLNLFLSEILLTAPQDIINEARNKQDIDLTLLLGGTLYNPNVKFDIDFPNLTGELNTYVQSKMRALRSNENSLNSQVLGLIVFNSFLPDNNPLTSGSVVQQTAISTLSEFVSSQVSQLFTGFLQEALAENGLIAGIDFELGLRQNSSIYNQNSNADIYPDEIEVHLNNRFRFLDERLSVGVGANYVRETSLGPSNYILPDFVLEYFLTNDRQLKLRVYGRSDIDETQNINNRRQKYGLGIVFRTEFGSLTDFKTSINNTVNAIAPVQNEN